MGYWEEFKSWYSWKNEFDPWWLLSSIMGVLLLEATGLSTLAIEGSSQLFAVVFLVKTVMLLILWQLLKLVGVLLVVVLPNKLKGGR